MTKRANQIADRILKAILRDPNPQDALAALQQTIVSVMDTLPPSQQRDVARRMPDMLKAVKRANKAEANAVWNEIDKLFPNLIIKQ
jgi:hypothetical protein